MNKILITITIIFCALLMITSCQKDERFEKSLTGTWKITKVESTKIFNDGTVEVVDKQENAGSFNFYYDNSNLSVFDFTYLLNGQTQHGELVYYGIDDHAKRIIIYGGVCISCDIAYTIEKSSGNKLEMSTYDLEQQGLSTDFVYKLKFYLEKE